MSNSTVSRWCQSRFAFSIQSDDASVHGFVLDLERPMEPTIVDVKFDGNLFASLRCVELLDIREVQRSAPHDQRSKISEDFVKTLGGTRVLAVGFKYRFPEYLPRNRTVTISVCDHATGAEFYSSSRSLGSVAKEALHALMGQKARVRFSTLGLADGQLDLVAYVGGRGMEAPPVPIVGPSMAAIPFERRRLESPPEGFFNFDRDVPYWAIRASLAIRDLAGASAEVRLKSEGSGEVIGAYQSALFVPENVERELAAWHLPEDWRIRRVMGVDSSLEYYLGGYATFRCIDRALRKAAGSGIADFQDILDWGSGCARLTQQIIRRTNSKVSGLDIDDDNVSWCATQLPQAQFHKAPLVPPSSLPSASFDLITGVSVFTHLDERMQFAWLGELHRLLKPQGLIVVSIKSAFSLYQEVHPVQRFWTLEHAGIDDGVVGTLLDEVLPEGSETYYRETNHSHAYVLARWSRWFEVLGLYLGAHFDYQDFCVMRRRDQVWPEPSVLS